MRFEKLYKEISLFFQMFNGVGEKKSFLLTEQLLNFDKNKIEKIINILVDLKDNIKRCSLCNNFTYKDDICEICIDNSRSNELLIIEDFNDLISIEKTKIYNGFYFILFNLISPIKGITPDNLFLDKLKNYLNIKNIDRVIFGLPKTIEGNITTHFIKNYIIKNLPHRNIIYYNLAEGLSGGIKISEFPENTLKESIKNMKEF
ncbi:MAG: toprim domain-containing protein [Spirochaetes bacterium]|nr:toprim domain-containing protein [Spirochaetota bacterium]